MGPRQAVAMWLEKNPGWHTTLEIHLGLEEEGFVRKEKQIDSVLTNGMQGGGPKGLVASGLVVRRALEYSRKGRAFEYRRMPVEGGLL